MNAILNYETGSTLNGGGGRLKTADQRKLHTLGNLIFFTILPKQRSIHMNVLNYSQSNLLFMPHVATLLPCTRKEPCSNFGRTLNILNEFFRIFQQSLEITVGKLQ